MNNKDTLDFYNSNYENYIEQSKDLDLSFLVSKFLERLPKQATILDLGCGSGRDSLCFADRGHFVHAIDFCKPFIVELNKKKKKNIETYCVDIMDLRPSDFNESFDGIWSMASLLHLKKRDILHPLSCFESWLKPGGTLMIALKEKGLLRKKDNRHFSFYTPEEMESLFEKFNFEDVCVERENDFQYKSQKWLNCWAKGQKKLELNNSKAFKI